MTALVPRGFGSYPAYQVGLPNQYNNQYYYYGGYGRQPISFAPHYPAQPVYQPPMKHNDRYAPVPYFGPVKVKQPGLGTYALMRFNQLDEQYRYEQYLRQLKKMEKSYWKMQANNIPPQMYSNEVYVNYIKQTKFVPYPVYINSRGAVVNAGGGQGFFGSQNVPISNAVSLPPKIRVIFIPTGQSYAQQPYTGSLAMPPFLYNRMAQPLSSFPVPPPLPQVASLPLTPAVQQIVAQRYSNPVAVLPFPSNWPVSQPAIPSYVPAIQQQQQYVPPAPQMYTSPPIINISPPVSAPTYAVAPYSAALPQQQQQQQYVPQAPQTYTSPPIINVPPPPPTFVPSFQPDAQIPIGPPPPPLAAAAPASYYQPAPQANFPVSVASESSSSLSSSINVQSSSSNSNTVSSALAVQPAAPQYSYNTYPSICRACPPAPPPLNIPVTGYCWIQHCSACHHVPLANSYPNNRPAGGRNTPLLRQSTVPQYVPEQSYQHYRATDPPVMMRPWLRKTPPLPPGAVVISDEYVYKNGSTAPHSYSQRSSRRSDRSPHKKYRSTTTTTTTRTGYGANTFSARSMSPRKAYYNNNNSTNPSTNASQLQRSNGLKTAQSPSASTTSSNLSSEYERITIPPTIQTQKTAMPGPIAREARNVNLKYNYQPQELPTVYNVNPYLKSSSEASSLSTNTERKFHDRSPYMKNSNSIASSTEQEDDKPPRPPSHLKKAIKNKVLVIREFTTNSPSTISTISSNISFSIINKDEDSLSITSTIDEHKQEENDTLQRHIF